MTEISEEEEEKEIREAFKVFDRYGRGVITINDLKPVMQGMVDPMSEDERKFQKKKLSVFLKNFSYILLS